MLLKDWGSNADFLLSVFLPLPPILVLRENLWTAGACQRIENYACSLWASVEEKKADCFHLTPNCCSVLKKRHKSISDLIQSPFKSVGIFVSITGEQHRKDDWFACSWGIYSVLFRYSMCILYFCVDSSGIVCEEKLLFRSIACYTHLSVRQ